jgi:hypothetical protein
MEKRRHPRFRARFDSLLSAGRTEGAGVLVDISYSGARLEETTLQPEPGSKVRLYVFVQPVAPFEILGEVVRSHASGFAIAYQVESPEVQRLVDDVAALVCA